MGVSTVLVARWLDVFPLSIVGVEESFHMKPHAMFCCVSASTQTHKVTIVGLVGVTAHVEIAVRRPAVTDTDHLVSRLPMTVVLASNFKRL